MIVEIDAVWIGSQRLARLLDCLIDGPQVVLDYPYRFGIEPAPAGLEYPFEVGDGLIVVGVGKGRLRTRDRSSYVEFSRRDNLPEFKQTEPESTPEDPEEDRSPEEPGARAEAARKSLAVKQHRGRRGSKGPRRTPRAS